jgi:SAM-dependent methyltransferase
MRGQNKDNRGVNLALDLIKFYAKKDLSKIKILDFGCGNGKRVEEFLKLGLNAFGVDVNTEISYKDNLAFKCKHIPVDNYKIPFEDNFFDFVISSSVLEHVQNHEIVFKEIHRVLNFNGYAIHGFPSKYYLPREPHMMVPFVNFFNPMPEWIFYFFAILRVGKNIKWTANYNPNYSFTELAKKNLEYSRKYLNYKSNFYFNKLSLKIFGNFSWPMHLYIEHAHDSVIARFLKKLPLKKVSGFILCFFRMALLVNKKNNK